MDLILIIVVTTVFVIQALFFIYMPEIRKSRLMRDAYLHLMSAVFVPVLGAILLAQLYALVLIYEDKLVDD